ncbi:hypothetical protein [Salana multivorans]
MSLAPASRLAVAAVGVIAALSVAACSPVKTMDPYAASDGVRVTWEKNSPIRAENVLVIAAEEGGDARVVAGLANGSAEDAEIEIGFTDGASESVSVPAGTTVLLNGTGTDDVVLPSVPVPPGATVEMTFTTAAQGTVQVQVPVLDGSLTEYADLVP